MEFIKLNEHAHYVSRMIDSLVEAQTLARSIGISNITQPGLIKEVVMALELGHDLIPSKRLPDACSKTKPTLFYEYLSCQKGKDTFAFDDMKSRPLEAKEKSLNRIKRNDKVLANHTDERLRLKEEKGSKNSEHTITYKLEWVKQVGIKVYERV